MSALMNSMQGWLARLKYVEKQSDALERSMKSGLYIHSLPGLPGNEIKAQEDSGQRPSALENGYLDRKTPS